jgi:hypothetical protein
VLIITAPIEVGPIGIFKFLLKTLLYGYKLDELPGEDLYFKYLKTLLTNGDVKAFRDARHGWGTHFGFDHRLVSKNLDAMKIDYRSFTKGTTRFFVVKP